MNEIQQFLNQLLTLLSTGSHSHRPHASTNFDTYDDEDIPVDNPFADPDRRTPRAPRWDSGFRTDLLEFHGDMDPDGFLDWLAAVEEILAFAAVPADRRVALIATRLRGHAAAWWQQLKFLRQRRGKPFLSSCEKFIKHLRAEYLPFNYSRTLYQKFQNLRQGTRLVDAYTEEFYHLLSRVEITETPYQLISRIIGGLRLQYQDILNLFTPISVSDAHQRALLLEQQFNRPLLPLL